MNLVNEPWIPAVTVDQRPVTVGLAGLFARADELATITADSPLEQAALWRLVMACALAGDGDPAGWLAAHADRFNLFDRSAPFMQDARLAGDWDSKGAAVAAGAVSMKVERPVCGPVPAPERVDAATVWRTVLTMTSFSVAGAQAISTATCYGSAVRSAKKTVAGTWPWVMWRADTVAATIAANWVDGPAGTFHFTWPDGKTPGQVMECDGPVAALTWPTRVMLLHDAGAGMVDRLIYGAGLPFIDHPDPQLLPHTTWSSDADGTYTPTSLSTPIRSGKVLTRPAWQHMLAAWAQPHTAGILASHRGHGHAMTITGLHASQARIEGPAYDGLTEPVIDPADVRTLLDVDNQAYRRLYGASYAVARTIGDDHCGDRIVLGSDVMAARSRHIIEHALGGHIGVADAADALNDLYADAAARIAAPYATRYPHSVATAIQQATPRKDTRTDA